ncbi:hypothetical protein ATANTOWER_021609 [Ataeniobius toweri]|uniref:Uncharacterized protein n=1 Tax=Ataeniobius toweri TaxID=208326 RepID=A0ABU7BUE1_9TELE|nr:hypothetical protein [Ataeniobius toweri]
MRETYDGVRTVIRKSHPLEQRRGASFSGFLVVTSTPTQAPLPSSQRECQGKRRREDISDTTNAELEQRERHHNARMAQLQEETAICREEMVNSREDLAAFF